MTLTCRYRYVLVFNAILLMVLCFGMVLDGYGQTRVYATGSSGSGVGIGWTVTAAGNAASSNGVDAPSGTPANLSAGTLGTARLDLTFTSPIQNTTVWVRVSGLSGLLGAYSATAYSTSTTPATGSTGDLITMANGEIYFRISATQAFNRVRITAGGLLGGSINVHHAFYITTTSACTQAPFTSVSSSTNITNPTNAIDNNLNTHSTFSVTVGLLFNLTQSVYFPNLSPSNTAATITFSFPGNGLLDLSLLGDYTIHAYSGTNPTPVASQSLRAALLGLNLLTPATQGQKYTISFSPGGPFDRIDIVNSGVLAVLPSFNLYEVSRTPLHPTSPDIPTGPTICGGNKATLTASSTTSGSIIRWYDAPIGGNLLYSSASTSSYTTDPLINNTNADITQYFYAAAAWDASCPSESERIRIAVTVRPQPSITLSPLPHICRGVDHIDISYTATTNSPNQYEIVWTNSPTGLTNVPWTSLPATPIHVPIGTTTASGTYAATLRVRNTTTGCVSAGVPLNVIIDPKPGRPILTLTN